jgi:hypothetical protein
MDSACADRSRKYYAGKYNFTQLVTHLNTSESKKLSLGIRLDLKTLSSGNPQGERFFFIVMNILLFQSYYNRNRYDTFTKNPLFISLSLSLS